MEAENKVTFAYLEKIPYRDALKARLTTLQNYARFGTPTRKGEHYVFSKNDGLQNQSVLYIQKGLDGKPDVLLDPNKFTADGTSRLAGFNPSKDGRYAAYGISTGGSDWTEFHVMEVATRKTLPDVIKWAKVTGTAWQGNGFYYSRYDAPDSSTALTSKNEGHKVYYHKIGTPQAQDELVFEDKANPQRFHNVSTTEDERFAILNISDRGKGKRGNAVFFRDRSDDGRGSRSSPRSATTTTASSTTWATSSSSRPITARRTAAWCSSIRSIPARSTGRPCCRSGRSRCRARARPAASCSRPTSRTSRPAPTSST